jgi:hypothetical protein
VAGLLFRRMSLIRLMRQICNAMILKKGFDFEQILTGQHYKGPDKESLKQSIRELDIQEPIEELLVMLTS